MRNVLIALVGAMALLSTMGTAGCADYSGSNVTKPEATDAGATGGASATGGAAATGGAPSTDAGTTGDASATGGAEATGGAPSTT
jgi:hypothetical protein